MPAEVSPSAAIAGRARAVSVNLTVSMILLLISAFAEGGKVPDSSRSAREVSGSARGTAFTKSGGVNTIRATIGRVKKPVRAREVFVWLCPGNGEEE